MLCNLAQFSAALNGITRFLIYLGTVKEKSRIRKMYFVDSESFNIETMSGKHATPRAGELVSLDLNSIQHGQVDCSIALLLACLILIE